ncbi:MAG: DUF1566 domain-containing protein [Spirochaetaceae bacterium]|nr:DUF1566 domain-containing protein [Spirochaetaceae bacterium]
MAGLGAVESDVPKLAVLPFDADFTRVEDQKDAIMIRTLIEELFVAGKPFVIIPPEQVHKLFTNGEIPKDIYQDHYLAKFKEAGINFVVTADLVIAKKRYTMRLYLLNITQGSFITSEVVSFGKSVREIRQGINKLILKFLENDEVSKIYTDAADGTAGEAGMPKYAIGDTGPGGGLVFYIKPTSSGGWRYMEAAPADIDVELPWGTYAEDLWKPNIPETQAEVGQGKKNTALLTGTPQDAAQVREDELDNITSENSMQEGAMQPEPGNKDSTQAAQNETLEKNQQTAAAACAEYQVNGLDGWFLPSKDELDLLYQNIAQRGLGNFKGISYWSSTQSSESTAWYQRMEDGRLYYNGRKTMLLHVRPVRAFK